MNRRFHNLVTMALGVCWLEVAAAAWGHGDEHEAIEKLSERIKASPESARLPLERAALYARHGEFALALQDLEKAEALDENLDAVRALRARIWWKMGKPTVARALQETYLQKHPEDDQVRFDYTDTLAALGEIPAALRELDALVARNEHPSPDVVARRIELTELHGADGAAQALDWLSGFLKSHPLPVFEESALRFEIKLGRISEALQRMDRMISGSARPAALLVRKAELLDSQQMTTLAKESAQAATAALDRLPDALRLADASQLLRSRIEKILSPPNP